MGCFFVTRDREGGAEVPTGAACPQKIEPLLQIHDAATPKSPLQRPTHASKAQVRLNISDTPTSPLQNNIPPLTHIPYQNQPLLNLNPFDPRARHTLYLPIIASAVDRYRPSEVHKQFVGKRRSPSQSTMPASR